MIPSGFALAPATRWRRSRLAGLFLGIGLAGMPAGAEDVPAKTVSLALGGEASFTLAPVDTGYFNDLDYGSNALRVARLSLTGRLRAGDRVALLTEVRTENFEAPYIFALYLNLRPLEAWPLTVQVGRVPPVFGSYPRRGYAASEPLPGAPLPYQYLTTLRPDAVPGTADQLLVFRGEGWRVRYPVGSTTPGSGLPLMSAFQWDVGALLHAGTEGGPVEASVALTRGTLSHPQVHDDNEGKQLAGRVAFRPVAGLVAGFSAARGEYVANEAMQAVAAITGRSDRYYQDALGVDLEYGRGHSLWRAEAIWSRWDVPAVGAPVLRGPLEAWSGYLEGRYRLAPGLSLAARAERLDFSEIQGSVVSDTWDAPVTRVEAGLAYAVRRHVLAKAAYQYNWRQGGRVRQMGFPIGQLVLWF